MSERAYKSAAALEMAVKSAARKSGQDVGKAIEAYYPGRLLERVFSEESPSFVLKGGRGMLARTVDARYTRDTDFLYRGADLDEALKELKRLAAKDLGDFIDFRFVSASPIAEGQEYREGMRVVFVPVLGGTKVMTELSIDLVVDQVSTGVADVIAPANRLDVAGLPVFDYHVYPAAHAIADKVCATLQGYPGGRCSSRVRDLVDICVYAVTEPVDGFALSTQLALEARLRGLGDLDAFYVPDSWRTTLSASYAKSAKEAKLPDRLRNVDEAVRLAKDLVDPAIAQKVDSLAWDHEALSWVERAESV